MKRVLSGLAVGAFGLAGLAACGDDYSSSSSSSSATKKPAGQKITTKPGASGNGNGY